MKSVKRSYSAQVFMMNGKARTLRQISEFVGVKMGTLYQRLRAGYTFGTGQAMRPTGQLHRVVVASWGPKAQPIPGQRKDD